MFINSAETKRTINHNNNNNNNLILCPPKRAGRRHSLCAEIKRRITSYSTGPSLSCHSTATGAKFINHQSSNTTLSQAITTKLEDGNIRAAVWLLMSQDKLATVSEEFRSCCHFLRWPAPSAEQEYRGRPTNCNWVHT